MSPKPFEVVVVYSGNSMEKKSNLPIPKGKENSIPRLISIYLIPFIFTIFDYDFLFVEDFNIIFSFV